MRFGVSFENEFLIMGCIALSSGGSVFRRLTQEGRHKMWKVTQRTPPPPPLSPLVTFIQILLRVFFCEKSSLVPEMGILVRSFVRVVFYRLSLGSDGICGTFFWFGSVVVVVFFCISCFISSPAWCVRQFLL